MIMTAFDTAEEDTRDCDADEMFGGGICDVCHRPGSFSDPLVATSWGPTGHPRCCDPGDFASLCQSPDAETISADLDALPDVPTLDAAVDAGIERALEQLGIAHLREPSAAAAEMHDRIVRDRDGCYCWTPDPVQSATPLLDSITARLLRERDEARALVADQAAEIERLRGMLAKWRAA